MQFEHKWSNPVIPIFLYQIPQLNPFGNIPHQPFGTHHEKRISGHLKLINTRIEEVRNNFPRPESGLPVVLVIRQVPFIRTVQQVHFVFGRVPTRLKVAGIPRTFLLDIKTRHMFPCKN